jgi:hypothetical protein
MASVTPKNIKPAGLREGYDAAQDWECKAVFLIRLEPAFGPVF